MQLKWHAEVAEDRVKEAMKLIQQSAMIIKGDSQTMCPVDTGTLRNSAVVSQVDEKTFSVGYGGAASSYALQQHENLQYHHNVGQAKFLEIAFEKEVEVLQREFKRNKIT